MARLLLIVFVGALGFYPIKADEVVTSADKEKVIVVQKGDERLLQAPKVFVESGTDEIAGSPEGNLKAAYRTWEQKCEQWKSELRHQNGNQLMIASCGTPTHSHEVLNSDKIYTYRSKATYKIKVVGK